MNKKTKTALEMLVFIIITVIISLSSPLNPWLGGSFTEIQNEILDISYSIRQGFLAYVELDGHYGPALYEFYGLGYLPTDTNVCHFIMELVLVFFTVMFNYKTASLYTSKIFSFVVAAVLTIFEIGSFTHAGAEELLYFIFTLTVYHVARQLKYGFLSYHTYLLAIDFALVFFIQPGYSPIWFIMILFFAIKYPLEKIPSKDYKAFWFSVAEGLITVLIPMGLYLCYFKNSGEFWENVVIYTYHHMGSFSESLRTLCFTPWFILTIIFLVVISIKKLKGEHIADLCYWLYFMVVSYIVIALQPDNLPSIVQFSKALYIIPLASTFSLVDKLIGLESETRKF